MPRRRLEYRSDLAPFLASVFFGFSINILTAETGGWWGPLQPLTRYPWIWVPICLGAWIGWDLWRRARSRPTWSGPDGPYPGLAPFDAAHAEVFFGREPEINEVLTRLDRSAARPRHRFVVLVGPSGSGKSSIIRAGVIPRLPKRWRVLGPVRLGGDPFGALAEACYPGGDRAQTARLLRDEARRGGTPNHLLALLHADAAPAVLVVDQWEDLYALSAPGDRSLFLELLAAGLTAQPYLHVLAAMRPEFYPGAQQEPVLPAVEPVPVASLGTAQVRDAIERPAEAAGVTFEDGVVRAMVVESTIGDALPLLAHLLQQLHRAAGDTTITMEQYEAAGRVGGAIARHADQVSRQLLAEIPRDAVDRLLLRGVGIEGGRVVRRSIPRSGLDEQARVVVTAFLDARLMVDSDGGQAVEFAHEAVFREWPDLVAVIEEHREQLRRITLLEQRATAWADGGQRDDLLRGAALEQGEALVEQIPSLPVVLQFLEASRAASDESSSERADQAAAWAQQLAGRNHDLALAVAAAALAELATTPASALTLWGLTAVPDRVFLPVAHTGEVCSLVWMPDGRLRSLDVQGKVCDWNGDGRTEESHLGVPAFRGPGHLSRQGTYVLGLTQKRSLGVWQVADGKYLGGRKGFTGADRFAWADDSAFATRFSRNGIEMYAVEGLVPVHRYRFEVGLTKAIRFAPAGDYLGVANSRELRIFRNGASTVPAAEMDVGGNIRRLAFAPGGGYVAVLIQAVSDRPPGVATIAVYAWDGQWIAEWRVEGSDPPIEWSPDGTTVAYVQKSGLDRYVELRRMDDLRKVHARRKANPIHLAWSPDGRQIAMGGRAGEIDLWVVGDDHLDARPGGRLRSAAWSFDGSIVAVSTYSRPARIIEPTGQIRELPEWTKSTRLRWSPVAAVVAVAGLTDVWLYSADGELGTQVGAGRGSLTAFEWSPDGAHLAVSHSEFLGSRPAEVTIWDSATGTMVRAMAGEPGPRHLAYCPDGRRLAAPSHDGAVIVWNTDSGEVVARWEVGATRFHSFAWTPDGRRLAASFDQHTHIWDASADDEGSARCAGQFRDITALCWSPDSGRLVGADGERLTIWDTLDGKPLATVDIPTDSTMIDLRWDDRLQMTFADGEVLSWSVPDKIPPAVPGLPELVPLTDEDRQRYGLPSAPE